MTGRSLSSGSALRIAEGLVAVHLGHDDVEQDDVDRRDRRVAQQLQGGPAVLGFDRLVADGRQQPDQQPAIERGVVDDQDAAAGHARRRRACAVVAARPSRPGPR